MKSILQLFTLLFIYNLSHGQAIQNNGNGFQDFTQLKSTLQKVVDEIDNGSEDLVAIKDQVRQYLQVARKQNSPMHATHAARLLAALERGRGNRTVLLYYDSLRVAFARIYARPDTLYLALHSYSFDLINLNRIDDASPVLEEAKHIADSLANPRYQSSVYLNQGALYFKQMMMPKAISSFKQCSEMAKVSGDLYREAESRLWISTCYMYMAKFDSTFAGVFNVLEYYNKINYVAGIASCYSTLTEAYQFNGNTAKSIEYARLARELYASEKDVFRLAEQSQKLASLYSARKNFDSAFYFTGEAEEIYKKLNYQAGLAVVNTIKGSVYMTKGESDTAKTFFAKAAEINKTERNKLLDLATSGYAVVNAIKSGDSATVAAMLPLVNAKIRSQLPKSLVQDAADRLKSSKILGTKKDSMELKNQFGSVLVTTMEENVNPFTNAPPELDSMISMKNNRLLTEMETKYRTRLKDDSLKIEKQHVAVGIKSVQIRNIVILSVALISMLLVIAFIQQYKNRQRAETDRAKIELLQKEIHHRVKNNLAVIIRLIEVAGKNISDQDAMTSLQNRIRAIELLHKKLYQDKISPGKVSLQPYLEELVALIRPTFESDKQITTTVKADVELEIDTTDKIGLIVNELVTNSFKYAFTDRPTGKIDISLKRNPVGGYSLSVSDNGSGFNPQIKYRSYGMVLIRGLSHALNGKFKYTIDNGTRFDLDLPADA